MSPKNHRRIITAAPRFHTATVKTGSRSCSGMSASAKNGLMPRRTLTSLLDHLVRAEKHCRWHVEAERPGGLQIDHQFELGRLFGRQVRRFRTLENLVNEARRATI